MVPRGAAEAPLEQARLKAGEAARLVLEGRLDVMLHLGQAPALGGGVRHERLLVARAALEPLVREVLGEALVHELLGTLERLLVHAGAGNANDRVEPEESPFRRLAALLPHEALLAGRIQEQVSVRELEHAVDEGSHLHVRELGVAVVEP